MSQTLHLSIVYHAASALLVFMFGFFRLVKYLSFAHSCIYRLFNSVASVKLPKDMYGETIFGWNMLQSLRRILFLELNRIACCGDEAPNSIVYSLDGKSQAMLLDYERDDRPLIVAFGSLTCHIFQQKLKEYSHLVKELEDVADFLLVYIEEAHPSDGWRLKNNYEVNQHKSLDERREAAKYFVECMEFQGQIVVDSMENECTTSYAAFPIRLCIIFGGQVHYIGGVGPMFYKPSEVREWIERWIEKHPSKRFKEHKNNRVGLLVGNRIAANESEVNFNKKLNNVYKNDNSNKNNCRKGRNEYKNEETKTTRCTSHLDMAKIPRQP